MTGWNSYCWLYCTRNIFFRRIPFFPCYFPVQINERLPTWLSGNFKYEATKPNKQQIHRQYYTHLESFNRPPILIMRSVCEKRKNLNRQTIIGIDLRFHFFWFLFVVISTPYCFLRVNIVYVQYCEIRAHISPMAKCISDPNFYKKKKNEKRENIATNKMSHFASSYGPHCYRAREYF